MWVKKLCQLWVKKLLTNTVDMLYNKMHQDNDVKRATKANDKQVYDRNIFPDIFNIIAQEAYMQMFLDTEKYRSIQRALTDRLYSEMYQNK